MTRQVHFRNIGDKNKRLPESLEKWAQVGGGKKMKNSIRRSLVRPLEATFTTQHTKEKTQRAANCIEDFKSRSS